MKKLVYSIIGITLSLLLMNSFIYDVQASNNESASLEKNSSILYTTHVQELGWQDSKKDGEMAGTTGKSLRLEGIKIKLNIQENITGGIEYATHVQEIGWQGFVNNNEMSGTTGKSLRLEAIKIKLTGQLERKI